MKKNNSKKKFNVAIAVVVLLGSIIAILSCGYLSLDKIIIPNNFGIYGINNMKDLTNVFSSLYSVPKESELVKNGYSNIDLQNCVTKLRKAGYKIEDDGSILSDNFSSFKGNSEIVISDVEFTAICNKFIKSGILDEKLQSLSYIKTSNISILDLEFDIDETSLDLESSFYTKSKVKCIIKINTEDLCEHISKQMQTTQALLKIIIPSTLYFTVDFEIDLTKKDYPVFASNILINGKTENQSKTLINLFIEFIFPEKNVSYEEFSNSFSNIVFAGLETMGTFNFCLNADNTNRNGFIIK